MLMSRTEGSRALAIALALGVSLLGSAGVQAKRLPAPGPTVKKPAGAVAAPAGLGSAVTSDAAAKETQPAKPHDPFWRLRQPRPAPVKQAEAPVPQPELPRTNVPVMGGTAPAPTPSATTAFKVLN